MLQTAALVALQHHEKFDGTGYPYGLRGEQIHIYGRITALADVFDALSSDRIYRSAWPFEQVLDYIREQRGHHFDPELVDILFNHLDEFIKIRDSCGDYLQNFRQP
ncbi:3'3'-cGAMP-specific phosphodiesterase 2 [bioreactor metagenome]|uniref:3'3'-cGAMP-specific phosphodiesterase 2 n=1 Tax=bioreactor metagenome TaxID=1076179 RepID=A0A645FLK7_9ZZZZ